jgi:hypothetical protein
MSNDPSVSFLKPITVRSKCRENCSPIHQQIIAFDFEICLECRTVLKWMSETGFTNLAKQLIVAGVILDTFVSSEELLLHPQQNVEP